MWNIDRNECSTNENELYFKNNVRVHIIIFSHNDNVDISLFGKDVMWRCVIKLVKVCAIVDTNRYVVKNFIFIM